ERRDRVARIGAAAVRVRRRFEEQLPGAHEAVEPRFDVSVRTRVFEHQLRELAEGAELLVEPREALTEARVFRRGDARALEAAARIRQPAGLLARLEELQRRLDDAAAFF